MPTKFRELVDKYLTPYVDEHRGEPFTLWPMTSSPNGRPAPDAGRYAVSATGVLHRPNREAAVELGNRDRRSNELRSLINDPGYDLLVDRRHLPDGARQGDEVEIGGECYQVASARFDGVSRWELRLIRAGGE